MANDTTDYKKEWESAYEKAYATGRRHWRPELATPKTFVEFINSKWAPPKGSRVLEAGCGDGLNSVFLARAGYAVTGVDISEAAIVRAREVAAEASLGVEFLCLDLVRGQLPSRRAYDLWVDIKTLHCLWEDADRRAYLRIAASALRHNGILFLNCGLALADVRAHFPAVFAALPLATQAQADSLDRELPSEKRKGIRCETLDWYCHEIEESGLLVSEARREASLEAGWGAIIIAQKAT